MQMVLNKFQKNMLIGMYHHNTIEKNKKIVTSSLYNPNGKCRVIFCTNALGMGINFPNIRYVVHYGPPQNVEDKKLDRVVVMEKLPWIFSSSEESISENVTQP